MRENIAFPPILNEKRRFKWDIFVKTADQIVRNEQQKAKKTQEMKKTNSFSPRRLVRCFRIASCGPRQASEKREEGSLHPRHRGPPSSLSHGCRLPIFRK